MNLTRKERLIGIILTVLVLVTTLNSAYFFIGVLRFTILKWLAFNACSLASIVYLTCFVAYFIRKKTVYLTLAVLPLYYYGTMGLFLMPWSEANLFAHITHVLISINLIWIIYVVLKNTEFEALGKGLLIGIIVFVPIIATIQTYTQAHLSEFTQLLQGI